MVSVNEIPSNKPPLGATLAEGLRVLSADQTLVFNLYRKFVMPFDGMIYWVRASGSAADIQPYPSLATQTKVAGYSIQLAYGNVVKDRFVRGRVTNPLAAKDQGLATAESLFISIVGPASSHASPTTTELAPGQSFDVPENPEGGVWVTSSKAGHKFTAVFWTSTISVNDVALPGIVQVKGSLHYASHTEQNEDAIVDSNEVVFTSLSEIQHFNQVGPNQLYIAQYRDIRFAFSSRGYFYEQADLYHYSGRALYSVNATQIIDDPMTFNPQPVVSNSLPLWLALAGYIPPYDGFRCPMPLYPSFLVTDNLPPPFGAVHVDSTESLVAAPTYGPNWEQDQLSKDKVRITLYGLDNLTAQTFLAFVEQVSIDWNEIGIMNMPIVRDEKRTQPEFKILAQKKMIEFEVSYLQSAARNKARQLIEKALFNVLVDDIQVWPLPLALAQRRYHLA